MMAVSSKLGWNPGPSTHQFVLKRAVIELEWALASKMLTGSEYLDLEQPLVSRGPTEYFHAGIRTWTGYLWHGGIDEVIVCFWGD